MNLVKLFNFEYLKQNMKKSKGIITLLIFIIPVITSLILIGKNTSSYVSRTDTTLVSIANIVGMYIIPVIISYILYGYVYKRNSVDFINSMPLTRSTIYTTNFVGGVVVILCIQALTAIVTAILASILSNICIAPAMIIDIFIVMLLGYIFVFSSTSIAMTLSGNFLTQIVITLLIIFLIPFVNSFGTLDIDRKINLERENSIISIYENVNLHYTAPVSFIMSVISFGRTYNYFFDAYTNVKMSLLIVLYFVIGLYLFNKRKMENLGNSFSKLWVHLLVKGITLVPIVFIINVLKVEEIFLAIAVVLAFIYYCIYDFITNKKVPFKYTILTFIVAMVALSFVYKGINYVGYKLLKKNISVDDIAGIAIQVENNYYGSYIELKDNDVYITNENMIKEICNGFLDENNRYNIQNVMYAYGKFKVRLKNGKEIYFNSSINRDIYLDTIDYLINNDVKGLEKIYKINNDTYIIINGNLISKEDTQEILNIYSNIPAKDLLAKSKEVTTGNIAELNSNCELYTYSNHLLLRKKLNLFASQELFVKMKNACNTILKNGLEEYKRNSGYLNFYIQDKICNMKYSNEMSGDYIEITDESREEFIKYFEEHMDENFDMKENFYIFNINVPKVNSRIILYLKETEELDGLISKYGLEQEDTMVSEKSYVNDVMVVY